MSEYLTRSAARMAGRLDREPRGTPRTGGVRRAAVLQRLEAGLNKNVSKVRTDHDEYLRNILKQRHGSVLEHVTYSFVFHNVIRVLTHELVRHRPGVAISQESMRFVRLDDIPSGSRIGRKEDEELVRAG